jgi:hypothetical protein
MSLDPTLKSAVQIAGPIFGVGTTTAMAAFEVATHDGLSQVTAYCAVIGLAVTVFTSIPAIDRAYRGYVAPLLGRALARLRGRPAADAGAAARARADADFARFMGEGGAPPPPP